MWSHCQLFRNRIFFKKHKCIIPCLLIPAREPLWVGLIRQRCAWHASSNTKTPKTLTAIARDMLMMFPCPEKNNHVTITWVRVQHREKDRLYVLVIMDSWTKNLNMKQKKPKNPITVSLNNWRLIHDCIFIETCIICKLHTVWELHEDIYTLHID